MQEFSKYLESILHLFEYMILFYLFSQFFEQRFRSHYISYFIVLLLVGFNVTIELTIGLVAAQSFFIKLTLILLVFLLLFKGRKIQIILFYTLGFTLYSLTDFGVVWISMTVFDVKREMIVGDPYLRLGLGIISKTLSLGIGQFAVGRFNRAFGFDLRKFYQLVVILIINAAFIILTVDIYFQNKSSYSNEMELVIGIMFGIILLSYMVLRMTDDLIRYSMKERDWQLQEDEYQRQMFYMKNLEGVNKQLRSLRHDFNHHIGCINGMLELGDINGAKSYTDELVNQAEHLNVVFSTNHTGISGLLGSKYQIMASKNINFSWKLDLPEHIEQKAVDLSIIIGNALDNAIEATAFVEEELRYIDLKMYTELGNLMIKVENSFDYRRINMDRSTTKMDKVNHGYGLKNIEFVVNKYDGIMKIRTDNTKFQLNIALPNG